MEVKTMEGENKNESAAERKRRVLIRSAKTANLLSSLHNRLAISSLKLTQLEEETELRRENEDLKTKLFLEKVKNRKIKLCGFAEFLLKIVVCISFWLFFLCIVFIF